MNIRKIKKASEDKWTSEKNKESNKWTVGPKMGDSDRPTGKSEEIN